ncbi:hypothetical protein FJP68_14100 [Pantoea vagans]|nr:MULTISPECIES: hypothetical protein [Pantoea]TPD93522.1 hypothetical protein FJP68_14100 [Pantoea vagans]
MNNLTVFILSGMTAALAVGFLLIIYFAFTIKTDVNNSQLRQPEGSENKSPPSLFLWRFPAQSG